MSYYFISIGGSGAKTLESLIHICAAGLLPGNETLKVFSIDPDKDNGNLERSTIVLNDYIEFCKSIQVASSGDAESRLFKNEVEKIIENAWDPVTLSSQTNQTLDDAMAFSVYRGTPVGTLYETLYTKKERNTRLSEGFRGHPSIGAAILGQNQIKNNKHWNKLVEAISGEIKNGKEAKIFLAGSVFGGTGASGVPTVATLLRDKFKDSEKVFIACVLLLPYFKFSPEKMENQLFANSDKFLLNTKAALRYYSARDNVFNAMYFIGDETQTQVKNFSIGSGDQKNDANLMEFFAAHAAADFYSRKIDEDENTFHYLCRNSPNKFIWSDIPDISENFKDRFMQFVRFIFAYLHLIKPVLDDFNGEESEIYKYPWFVDMLKDVDKNDKSFIAFNDYAQAFVLWLKQIENLEDRDVSLVRASIFDADIGLTDPYAFNSLVDNEITDLTIHEIWCQLCETPNEYKGLSGFGKFLRRLYDVCELSAK